jgi:hypothetical protein
MLQKTLFEILLFLHIDFFAFLFGKMASKKIQDGVRFYIFPQETIIREFLGQKSIFLVLCSSVVFFSILKKTYFSKTLNFQNSSKFVFKRLMSKKKQL